MNKLSPESLLQQLNWRYATKRFDSTKTISESDWATMEKTLVLSPSSFGLQPWKFFVVTNKDIRSKLQGVSWNQPQIVEASHLVVVAALKKVDEAYVDKFIAHIAAVRGVSKESLSEYRGMMLGFIQSGMSADQVQAWATHQAYIALGVFLTSAAVLGIDACPMEGIDGAGYDKILGLEASDYHARLVVTAGYRSEEDKYALAKKVRFDDAEIIQHVK